MQRLEEAKIIQEAHEMDDAVVVLEGLLGLWTSVNKLYIYIYYIRYKIINVNMNMNINININI